MKTLPPIELKFLPVIIAGGWDGGGTTEILWVMLLTFIIGFSLFPKAAVGGYYHYGIVAYLQIPIAVGALAYVIYRQCRRPSRRPVMKVAAVYIATTITINIAASWAKIDHSQDFPLSDRFSEITVKPSVTGEQIVGTFGPPKSDSVISITDHELLSTLHSVLEHSDIKSARVLRYDETSPWLDHTTNFLVCDPTTDQLILVDQYYAAPGVDPSPPNWEPFPNVATQTEDKKPLAPSAKPGWRPQD